MEPRNLSGKLDHRILAGITTSDCKLPERRAYVFSHIPFAQRLMSSLSDGVSLEGELEAKGLREE